MKNLNKETVIEEIDIRLKCSKTACNADCAECEYCPREDYNDVLRSALYFLKKEEK